MRNTKCASFLQVIPDRPQIYLHTQEKAFTFDYAFDAAATQEQIYDKSVSRMVQKLFDGYNATVLAYGQTGSGKTHSMGTSYREGLTPPELAGIIPRAVADIFAEAQRRSDELTLTVQVAFVELYRETLYDLLSTKSRAKEDCTCDLREDPVKGVIIPHLTEVTVSSLKDTMKQLELGSLKRVTAATAMNNTSSRSHAIFTVFLNIAHKNDALKVTVSKFHLVDLAGSERAKKTKATGDRFNEGVAINQGLLALGNVIAALGEDNRSANTHIPYRNSKLTRMLQDSLGGNSYTLMVSCVSPADSNIEETISTLRYSDRAKKIKNKPIVNVNGNDAEVNRLMKENQELRLMLVEAKSNNGSGKVSQEEAEAMTESNERMREENKKLTRALFAAQEELAHMNEKALLHEASNEKIKTKVVELVAELDICIEKADNKESLQDFHRKLQDLVKLQEENENTIMDYDITRADDDECEETEESDEFAAAHALKRNALTVELQKLNKALAHKEKLASAMFANDTKFEEIRKKYETKLETLENDLRATTKERDELAQQHRNATADPSCKIAERRRHRIQELEGKIHDLKKQQLEQQKAIASNKKNEAQVKKLSEEIIQLKQAKVRLIKQFKEDAEKLRQYKQQKEKEVLKLKQNERKQQAKMAKMETLHLKKENVLRRKMEEAVNANKRLKDMLDKKKAASSSAALGRTLVGAGERVRTWIKDEIEMVMSVREAAQSKETLMNDRKTLSKELNDMKKELRDTMNQEQMIDHQKRMNNLKAELEVRNGQIAQLQKQIADAETAEKNNRFDNLKSLTEARIALDHLFEQSVDQTLARVQRESENGDLRQLYDEAVKNTNVLEKEIAMMKRDHERNLVRMGHDHEEKVLFLLGQMGNKDGADSAKDIEIQKMSKLNEELIKLSEENDLLRNKQQDHSIKMELLEEELKEPQKKKVKKQVRYGNERFTLDELLPSEDELEESYTDDPNNDPDWVKTPLCQRLKKLRNGNSTALKRKNSSSGEEDSEKKDAAPYFPPSKRSSHDNKTCGCKANHCGTKRCTCRKRGSSCTDKCSCDHDKCRNRSSAADGDSVLTDVTNTTNNSTTNTMSLLNDTYTAAVLNPSPTDEVMETESSEVNELLATPKKSFAQTKRNTIFKSPILKADE